EEKKIHGKTYYYYSKWGWVDGKCRRLWQKYLGKLENIAKAVQGGGPAPLYAEVFQWGLPIMFWKECELAKVVPEIDRLCPKREQGLSTGEYIAVAAINRAICPQSKRSMWEWFSQTVMVRFLPNASKTALTSQRFWDHLDKIKEDTAFPIWKNILYGVVRRENIDLSSISYDGTNFYTFIDTFNLRCEMAKRGKNKQGRDNLRQVSYALFCCAEGHMPLFYDVYEGSRNDAKQFPLVLEKFHSFFQELCGGKCAIPDTTIIFDKGNNSAHNFALIDSLKLHFVGSVKLDEHKELAQMSNNDPAFVPCPAEELKGTKAFRIKKHLHGQERILVVTYNQNLFNSQWLTLQNDIQKALEKLSSLRQKLEDRTNGLLVHGKAPTVQSIENQCKEILSRQHMKRIIKTTVTKGSDSIPRLDYLIDTQAIQNLADTYLGKNILITNREDWDDVKVIRAYRSQFIIEEVFKEMKDRNTGSWWPMCHWTDTKIKVHGLYCTIAILLRALALRRVRQAGLLLSMKRMLSELDAIREVVNIYPRKPRQKKNPIQTVLTKTSELQERLIEILDLKKENSAILG
ncbi:MAG: IS1634 family transposase, partial [Candidatus Tectomicrobia bacterium]|nr:IS1634 family transposase [Candidatus Tectomicrobia bacterium]